MHILVINSGSSSIKFSSFDSGSLASAVEPRMVIDGEMNGIGNTNAHLKFREIHAAGAVAQREYRIEITTPAEALQAIFEAMNQSQMSPPDAIGYRVVHPGAKLDQHQRITAKVLAEIEAAEIFAPLHDPGVVAIIREGLAQYPNVPQYACFDTVFHQTMPKEASTYAIPREFREQGVRRYGFHGLSCESIVQQLRAQAITFPKRMLIAHLGSGCSVTAVIDGCSVDTTMGLTPTGGIVMGTRPGDLDPGVVLYLLRQHSGNSNDAIAAVETLLNRASGSVALSGMANDMKAVRAAARGGDRQAQLAEKIFTRSVIKAIGGFCWLLGGLDAIVFSGGIGEHDAAARAEILGGIQCLGVVIDTKANSADLDGIRRISASDSETAVFIVPSEEDRMIATHVNRMIRAER